MSKIISTVGLLFFLTLSGSFTACKDTNSRQTTSSGAVDTLATPPPSKVAPTNQSVVIYAWVDRLRIRTEADTKADIVAEVAEGAALEFLGEKSDFTEKITLRGTLFNEPWLKVRTASGKEGWIYGGGVKFYAPAVDLSPTPYDDCFALFAEERWERGQSCMEKTHKKQLKKESRWVKETESEVDLLLLDGQHKSFAKGSLVDSMPYSYEYRYYLPKMGFHVLKKYGYEWSGFILVNDKSGRVIDIAGYPKPSPDFKYLVTTNFDLVAAFEFNGIQLYGFTEEGFVQLMDKELFDYGPLTPIWIDEKTVEIIFRPSEENPEDKDKRVQLVQSTNVDSSGVARWDLLD